MQWLNEPPDWRQEGNALFVTTAQETDFWQKTFYGFERDSGHFFYDRAAGDFTATLRFTGDYRTLYDQAGMMIRVDEHHWIKAGIEYMDGETHLSAVVTRTVSDWSVRSIDQSAGAVWVRASRHAEALRLEFSLDGREYRLFRLAFLPMPLSVMVGPMCCSPQRSGFQARFEDFQIGPALPRALHTDT